MRCVECLATTGDGRGPKKPDMGNRKVVITGLGLATALGLDVEENWRKALSGVSGVSRIKLLCAGKSSVQAAGQVSAEDWGRICSEFPSEAGLMLRNVENRGDPWGLGEAKRLEWAESLEFEIPVVDGTIPDDVEYLFWVGCAGSLDERARKTSQSIARLLHRAGVSFALQEATDDGHCGLPVENLVTLCVYCHLAEHGQLFYSVPAARVCSKPKARAK
jgi:Fe-S oxidoreductase